ncbi:MAG: DUF1016 N-terminal domain-containing protein [Coriobacteriales bacterium]|jgi:hypothetical protein|nr:DUF1016 N-terminal domain-containing protein [Coriobacteriales bacterium]
MAKDKIVKSGKAQQTSDQFNSKVYEDIRVALAEARAAVAVAVNTTMVGVYHEIGRQIAEAIGERAEYGKSLLAYLSERLTVEFGKGFTVPNLRNMRQFYQTFPNRYALRSELSWSHYRLLMRVEDESHREFYLKESADCGWTSRQLERQINSFFYERLLATQKESRPQIAKGIFKLEPAKDTDYILKDPYYPNKNKIRTIGRLRLKPPVIAA